MITCNIDFFLDPLKPHFYYISTGLRGSVLYGDFFLLRGTVMTDQTGLVKAEFNLTTTERQLKVTMRKSLPPNFRPLYAKRFAYQIRQLLKILENIYYI